MTGRKATIGILGRDTLGGTSPMQRIVGSVLLACVSVAAAGETESFWIVGDGAFNDPLRWNGPVPDETVTCIFDVDDKIGPFIFFEATGLSSRAIIRSGYPHFLMWDTDPKGEQFSHFYDVVNPSFNTPSFIVAENPGETATLNIGEGFVNAQSVVLGMGIYGAFSVYPWANVPYWPPTTVFAVVTGPRNVAPDE